MIDILKWKDGILLGNKKILSLAFEEKCILASDIYHDKEGFHVKGAARLDLPEGVSLDNPGKAGELLGRFIRENGMSARRCIIGIPAKWLMIREKIMPPSAGASIAGILKIHAEHEFSIGPDELIIDYTGNISSDKPSRLFLGALLRKNMDKLLGIVRSAGLGVLSVTVSSMALRAVICRHMSMAFPDYFIYLRPGYAEILLGDDEQIIDVKQIQRDDTTGSDNLISELRRIIAFSRKRDTVREKAALMILNLSDSSESEMFEIQRSLLSEVDTTICDPRSVINKMGVSIGNAGREKSLTPAALVQAYTVRGPFYPDFYNSRMNEKTVRIKKKQVVWASAITLCLIIFIFHMIFTWRSDKRDVADLKKKITEMSDDVKSAQDIVQKVDYARKWYSDRPEILRCLYELTRTFPVEGKIWATNLAINEEMKGIISGRAVDEKSVLEVLDSLKTCNFFSDVQMIYLRENGQNSQEVSFSMSFLFKSKGI